MYTKCMKILAPPHRIQKNWSFLSRLKHLLCSQREDDTSGVCDFVGQINGWFFFSSFYIDFVGKIAGGAQNAGVVLAFVLFLPLKKSRQFCSILLP